MFLLRLEEAWKWFRHLESANPVLYFARQLIQHNKKDGKSIYSYLHECDSNGATGLKFLPRRLFNF